MDIGEYFRSPWGDELGLGDLVTVFLQNAIIFAGIVVFIFILVGGFMYVVGSGNNDPQKAAQGKTVLTSALIGFIIVFTAYWIILAVQYITNVNILDSYL